MPDTDPAPHQTSYKSVSAYVSEDFRVEFGANLGDPFGLLDDLVLDDIYQLTKNATSQRLALAVSSDGRIHVAPDTGLGTPGARLHLDCTVTLMPQVGPQSEALILVETDAQGLVSQVFLLPLAPLEADKGYTLLHADRTSARRKLADLTCVSFSRGTQITLATGAQVPIEDLKPGDRVMTRDDGPVPVRWIGQTTSRAVGHMAPILIKAGALNNENDLIVSPDHRLFVYQRRDEIGTGCPEILIKASHLVNGKTVVVQDGGFVDYFQILFDRHHIIYAEGIAAESLLLDPITRPALPDELVGELETGFHPKNSRNTHGMDVPRQMLNAPNSVDILKRSSLGAAQHRTPNGI